MFSINMCEMKECSNLIVDRISKELCSQMGKLPSRISVFESKANFAETRQPTLRSFFYRTSQFINVAFKQYSCILFSYFVFSSKLPINKLCFHNLVAGWVDLIESGRLPTH